MKVILLKDVKKVGRRFEVREVADGFALNSLIPHGLAEIANPGNLKNVTFKKEALAASNAEKLAEVTRWLNEIKGKGIIMHGKMNEKGHLFAGIHQAQIAAEILSQRGIDISPNSILLEQPIKTFGEHLIKIRVGEKTAEFKLTVQA